MPSRFKTSVSTGRATANAFTHQTRSLNLGCSVTLVLHRQVRASWQSTGAWSGQSFETADELNALLGKVAKALFPRDADWRGVNFRR